MTARVIGLRLSIGLIVLLGTVSIAVGAQPVQRSFEDPPGLEYTTVGGADGWGTLDIAHGITYRDGWRGGREIVLADRAEVSSEAVDIYAAFDNSVGDITGRYALGAVAGADHITAHTRYGDGAIAFDGESTLALTPLPGSIFTPYAQTGSFSIDVWLYPTGVGEGVEILRWNGAFLSAGTPVLQELRFYIESGRLQWRLSNLVSRVHHGSREMRTVVLSGRRGPVPRRWTHHRLRYDAVRGQIAYLVDGVPEAIEYLSPSGREDGAADRIVFGDDTGEGLVIGRRFRGVIDELSISRASDSSVRTTRYDGDVAEVVTGAIPLGRHGGVVHAVRPRTVTPGNTEIRFYYRVGDRLDHTLPWRRLDDEDGIIDGSAAGAFAQVRAILLPDASGNRSPRLQEIEVAYRPHAAPPRPRGVRGVGIPGGVRIEWDPLRTQDVVEYRVLFGTRPGRYTGDRGVASPIVVSDSTSVTIEGLQTDRSYVFVVESIDRYGQRSALSREVEVRAGGMER